ncbi:hypothetical protein V565_316070, partial [Rhizoctonia solani 123E]
PLLLPPPKPSEETYRKVAVVTQLMDELFPFHSKICPSLNPPPDPTYDPPETTPSPPPLPSQRPYSPRLHPTPTCSTSLLPSLPIDSPPPNLHKPEPMMSRVQSSIRKELKLKTKGKGRERPEEKEEI